MGLIESTKRPAWPLAFCVLLALITAACGKSPESGKPPTSPLSSPLPPAAGKVDAKTGDLWIGTIDGELTETYLDPADSPGISHYTAHFQVRLRERNKRPIYHFAKKPPYRWIVGWGAELWNEGTRVDATFDGPNCSDRASTTYSKDDFGTGYSSAYKDQPAGHYFWKSISDELVTFENEDLPMDGIYRLTMGHCCWDPCARPGISSRISYALAGDPISIGFAAGGNSEFESSLKPPRYHHMNADHTRMTGSFDVVKPFRRGNDHLKVSWNLCKEGSGACSPEKGLPDVPPPPPPQPTPTPPPPPTCDPGLQADADRKWQAAQDLFTASAKHLADASKAFHDWKVEEAKTMAEIALEKNDLLKTVELALEEGGQHLLHSAVGWFGLATTAAWVYTDVYPHVREHDQAVRDAAKMTETATKLADDAIQDLRKSFGQDSACEEVRQKAIARDKLLDQAKALREKWALDGSALYKDPQDPSAYPMDANAALNRAIQILTARSASASSAASAPPPSSAQAAQTVRALESRATSPQGLTVTVSQGRAALAEVDASIQMMSAGRDMLEKRKAFAEAWAADLATLIAKWK